MVTALLTKLLLGVTVTLPMEARVPGTEVTLGQIATVTGDDPDEVAAVEAVHLGYAPMPGYSRLFHAVRLAQVVQRETGLRVLLAGDRACRVWPLSHRIPAAELSAAASGALDRLAAGHDVEYELRPGLRDVEIPAGVRGYVLESRLEDDALRSGTLSVPVSIVIDGALYRTVWTSFDVSIYESRTVLGRDVRAGERLTPHLFTTKRIEVPRPGRTNPIGRRMVVGAVATRDLRADAFVTELDVRRPLAVKSGDTVYLQARHGAVVARVPAVARENGAVGDRILVETTSSGHPMTAVILSQDVVEIDLGSR